MGNRWSNSVSVAKQCWAVIKGHPALAVFPFISLIATILVSLPFVGYMFVSGLAHNRDSVQLQSVQYVVLAITYVANYFVIIFFNTALAFCVRDALQGRPTTFGAGISAAVGRLPQIFGWAVLSATVGMILRMISERMGIIGRIVIGIIGIAWNVGVYFVVPCLAFEGIGPFGALKQSVAMLKRTWGERLILGIGSGMLFGVLGLLVLVPIVLAVACAASGAFAFAIAFGLGAVLYLLALSVIAGLVGSVLQTVLYLFVQTGQVPPGFDPTLLQNAFRQRRQRGFETSGFGY